MLKFVKAGGRGPKTEVVDLFIEKYFDWTLNYFPNRIFHYNFKVDF